MASVCKTWASERLNGFSVYGYKLTVKKAYQNRRGGVRVKKGEQVQPRIEERNQDIFNKVRNPSRDASLKKVTGHVNDEDLWNLQNCFVGETTSVCSVKSIADMLEAWGLNGIRVQRMGGKTFLLSFEYKDLFIMLEDLQWAYLKEIYCNVVMWSKDLRTPNRATWIEVRGLPLHTWNGTSLKRITELWGNFEAYGDNKTLAISDSSQSDDSSECSSSRVKKGDDVEHISLIAKEADNENGEEGVGQKARSWAEVLTVGEKNLGLSQLDGVEEEFKQFM
ncbi:hypothetical protein V6N13_108175 [Hibiscus sabdariffa]